MHSARLLVLVGGTVEYLDGIEKLGSVKLYERRFVLDEDNNNKNWIFLEVWQEARRLRDQNVQKYSYEKRSSSY